MHRCNVLLCSFYYYGVLLLLLLTTNTVVVTTAFVSSSSCNLQHGVPAPISLQGQERTVVSRLSSSSSPQQTTDDDEKVKSTFHFLGGNNDDDPYIDIASTQYDGLRPDSSWNLAKSNFLRQAPTIFQQFTESLGLTKRKSPLPDALGLVLSNEAVTAAEDRRIAATGGVPNVHPVSQALYNLGCAMLDTLFDERPIQRFWFLEIVARIPYFSYVSMLHLYESLGWWRAVELRKVHAAEEWNELHHLLIMESLGGNSRWSDRFLGYHAAIVYYWLLNLVFLGSPRIAYQFMELLESHAVDTYSTFVEQNKERLQSLPPPKVATSYYASGDLYLFDEFQVSRAPGTRRPPCDNLYDVFCNIANDEGEHVKTMAACQKYALTGTPVVSPHVAYSTTTNDDEKKRQMWKEWSEEINKQVGSSTEMDGW